MLAVGARTGIQNAPGRSAAIVGATIDRKEKPHVKDQTKSSQSAQTPIRQATSHQDGRRHYPSGTGSLFPTVIGTERDPAA